MGSETNFKSIDALSPLERVIDEAEIALQDKHRTISNSSIPEVLGGIAGIGAGAAGSFAALYFLAACRTLRVTT